MIRDTVYAQAEVEDEAEMAKDLDLGAWGGDLDLGGDEPWHDLGIDLDAAAASHGPSIARGDSAATRWLRARKLPADLVPRCPAPRSSERRLRGMCGSGSFLVLRATRASGGL